VAHARPFPDSQPVVHPQRTGRNASPRASGPEPTGWFSTLRTAADLSAKPAARAAALAFFAAPAVAPPGFLWALRLNHVTTEPGLQDLLALRGAAKRPAIVVLPKTESVSEVDIAVHHLSDGGAQPTIVALIETGRGLSAAEAIAAHSAVAALAFGGADLNAEFAWEPMQFARSRIVQAAATAAIPAWDVPYLEIHDAAGLKQETVAAKTLGYSCKLAIHPAQINAIFSPTPTQLAHA
jgi:(S)-citramalyl-CoA lyase